VGDLKDYGDHQCKLNPDGLNLTDVSTDIPPVRHRTTKTRTANELSIKLLQRVLEISTRPVHARAIHSGITRMTA
jgi:site-specific DNA-methyltransferase (adenine-specific)